MKKPPTTVLFEVLEYVAEEPWTSEGKPETIYDEDSPSQVVPLGYEIITSKFSITFLLSIIAKLVASFFTPNISNVDQSVVS